MRNGTYEVEAGTTTRSHPVLTILAAIPMAFFVGALLTDLAYVESADILWLDFSSWLLAAGMALAVIAAVAGLVVIFTRRRRADRRPAWPIMLCSVVVLVVAFLDNLVHSRDGWTAVVPLGLELSALTVLATLVTAWVALRASSRRVRTQSYAGAV